MAFTVRDFHDLVEILEVQPAWRAELRRLVLTDDILNLPQELHDLAQVVRELSESQRRYAEKSDIRFDRVEADIHELKTDVSQLKTDVSQLKTDVSGLKTDVSQLKTDVSGLKTDFARLESRVGNIDGRTLQQQVRERLSTYLSRFALRLKPISNADLAELLEIAVEEGRISDEQAEDAKLIDAVARGRRRGDNAPIYLALEISAVVDEYDLARAARRATIIAEATGTGTQAVVVGETVRSDVRSQVEQLGAGYVVLPQD